MPKAKKRKSAALLFHGLSQMQNVAQVCLDMHAALGVRWGDDPYAVIEHLKTAEKAAEAQRVLDNTPLPGRHGKVWDAWYDLCVKRHEAVIAYAKSCEKLKQSHPRRKP